MNLAILSLFRDSAWYLDNYIRQVERLAWCWPGTVRVYAVEGDSTDDTLDRLAAWDWQAANEGPPGLSVEVVKYDHGFRKVGSTQHPKRLESLAQVGNAGLDAIAEDDWADVVWFIDSDYKWKPTTAIRLWDHGKRAIAPYPMARSRQRGRFFYDTWGWSIGRRPFRQWGPPYHPAVKGKGPHEVTTVGGSLMMDAQLVYDGARMTPSEPIRGLCRQIGDMGETIWADPQTRIWHLYPWSDTFGRKVRLNLACGRDYRKGYINVDHGGAGIIEMDQDVDLNGPWPWADHSIDSILARNIFEHLDDVTHAMAESHRILKPGGTIEIVGPASHGPNWCADVTHRRAFNVHTFDLWDPDTLLGAKSWNFVPTWRVLSRELIEADWFFTLEPRPCR